MLKKSVRQITGGLLDIPEEGTSPERYRILRRNITVLMLLITIIPLVLMAIINYYQYQTALKDEILAPLRVLVNKTKHSFELFLAGRLSTVNFIASAYTYEELADDKNLSRIFFVLKKEIEGIVDIGLIDSGGQQVSYAGPYELKGKNYSDQEWFEHVKVAGVYISNVFMGYRRFPHIVMAVRHFSESGDWWVVRVTIDTAKFEDIIVKVLDHCAISVPQLSYEPNVVEMKDLQGRDTLMAYAYLNRSDFILMLLKPSGELLKAWYTLKSELLLVFIGSVLIIVIVVLRLTGLLVDRMKQSDDRRELAYREIEHSQKLSSIGRLAAGVAHEVNNPLAIINEKAGLMKDMVEFAPEFRDKDVFLAPIRSIIQSVERCRAITHRLLGFAKRMDVEIEILDINELVKEVLGFLEKEALYRNIKIGLHLAHDLPRLASDRGQLQQVILNILNNAFAAVQDGGTVSVVTWDKDVDTIGITFQDTGQGMSEETLKHIFEPFFTTKKGQGTGLGLSITYGIVKRLGGDIDVQSRPGKGTRFTVFLPKKNKEGSGD
jgi:two-component system NtrC family sensor kinase